MKAHRQVSAPLWKVLLVFVATLSASAVGAAPKIAEGAVAPITRAQYPKLFAEWGSQGIQRINKLAPLAAKKAADSPECDQVEIVEVSDRSIARKKVVFFVDCANSKRFYIDEDELKSAQGVRSQEAKTAGISDEKAIDACDKAVRRQLRNPLTFNRHFLSSSVHRVPTLGNVVVEFTFDAKNDLGANLPRKAHCTFTDRGLESVEVTR